LLSLSFTAYINSIIIIIINTRYDSDENIHGIPPPSPVSSSSAQLPYIITCIKGLLEGRKSKGGWMESSRKTESARKGLGKKEYISTREVEEEKRCYIIGITDCQWQHATSAQRMKVTNHACKTSSSLEE